MDTLDRDALIEFFNRRFNAPGEAMRRYWEGRIDEHCLQNAIDEDELVAVASKAGFRVDWQTAAGAEVPT